jgi:hypothetical protein
LTKALDDSTMVEPDSVTLGAVEAGVWTSIVAPDGVV